MGGWNQVETLAAVSRAQHASVEGIDRVDRLGVGIDLRKIPGPLAQAPVVIDPRPVVSSVVRAIETAILGLDHGVDAIGIRAGDGDIHAAQDPRGQPVSVELDPGHPAIGRTIESAARTAAGQAPGRALHLP